MAEYRSGIFPDDLLVYVLIKPIRNVGLKLQLTDVFITSLHILPFFPVIFNTFAQPTFY
jgi:hypothetical protein